MLGVDRLDMIKGIPQKILAFEKFLEENAHWRDKVVLLQIAVPTRTDVSECKLLIFRHVNYPLKHCFFIDLDSCHILFIGTSFMVETLFFLHYLWYFSPNVVTDQKLTSQVHEIVGRINGRFGTLTAVPIHHLVSAKNIQLRL